VSDEKAVKTGAGQLATQGGDAALVVHWPSIYY
jgi:hypothetical protein